MRRQLGANEVEIDTEAEYARYTLWKPTRIDFGAILEAAKDAGYTLTGIQLDIAGVVTMSDCTQCESTVPLLEIATTGQSFELEGEFEKGATIHITAAVRDWNGEHPVLDVLESRPRAE